MHSHGWVEDCPTDTLTTHWVTNIVALGIMISVISAFASSRPAQRRSSRDACTGYGQHTKSIATTYATNEARRTMALRPIYLKNGHFKKMSSFRRSGAHVGTRSICHERAGREEPLVLPRQGLWRVACGCLGRKHRVRSVDGEIGADEGRRIPQGKQIAAGLDNARRQLHAAFEPGRHAGDLPFRRSAESGPRSFTS
jgi:hypothetical protein